MWRLAILPLAGALASCAFAWEAAWPLFVAACAFAFVSIEAGACGPVRLARAFAFALGLYGAGLHWLFLLPSAGLASHALAGALVLLLAGGWTAAVSIGAWLAPSRTARWCLAVPAGLAAFDWLRSLGDWGFPWLASGYSQPPQSPLAAFGALGGPGAVGFVALAASGLLATSCTRNGQGRVRAATVLLGLLLTGIGLARVPLTSAGPADVRVGVAQASLGAVERSDEPGVRGAASRLAALVDASDAAVTVLPEAAWHDDLARLPDDLGAALLRARARGSRVVFGAFEPDRGSRDGYFNVAVAAGPGPLQRYRKQRPVPFGEAAPDTAFGAWFERVVAGRSGLHARRGAAGQDLWRFDQQRIAVMVCWDALAPDAMRANAAAAHWLIDLADDGWVDSPWLVAEHRRVAQARAIEFGKPVVLATNRGASGFVDAHGRFAEGVAPHESALAVRSITPHSGATPYALFGDAPVIALVLLAALASRARRPAVHEARSRLPLPGGAPGQILPLGLLFLLGTGAILYWMVNSGELVKEKLRVAAAADAAAYSAGVVQARALNFTAYANRAMVANEVAVAQAVSLLSWIGYFAKLLDNGDTIAADAAAYLLVPPTDRGAYWAAAGSLAEYVQSYTGGNAGAYAREVREAVAPLASMHSGVSHALSLADFAVVSSLTLGLAQGQLAGEVVRRSDPSLRAEVVIPSYTFDRLTHRYVDDERRRFADVALHSLDPFTRQRDWSVTNTNPAVARNIALKRRGGTGLSNDLQAWRAIDTLEMHAKRARIPFVKYRSDIRQPLAWGAASAQPGSRGDPGRGQVHRPAYDDNPRTAGRADDDLDRASYLGIPDSYDVAATDPADEASNTGEITIMVSKPQRALMTSGNASAMAPSGRLDLYEGSIAGGLVVALARAQVYFEPPEPRTDKAAELSHLYAPFWQVRLVKPDDALDYGWAAVRQGGRTLGPSTDASPLL